MGQRAIVCGYYGKGNGGDEALLATLLQMLPCDWRPIILTADPAQTQSLHGTQVCDRYNFAQIIHELRRADYFIWGGGSLIQDSSSWRNPYYYAGLMGLAQRMGVATIAWAQGIGPLRYPASQWLAKSCLKNCTRISVRDAKSAQLLSNWSIPATIAPDPVWALTAESPKGLWNLPAPRIAVNLRSHPLLSDQILQTLTKALLSLQKATDALILLVPFQPSHDLAIAAHLHSHIKHSHIWQETNPRLLKGLFRGVEMTIAMRLHAVIMSASEGSRCFALSYDPKVRSVMDELNIQGYDLAQIPNQPQQISRDWLEFYANGEPLNEVQLGSLHDRALIHQSLLTEITE